eukprot:SAG22_NODE_1138_length_5389_cov_22.995085_5_plen_69_part_00
MEPDQVDAEVGGVGLHAVDLVLPRERAAVIAAATGSAAAAAAATTAGLAAADDRAREESREPIEERDN